MRLLLTALVLSILAAVSPAEEPLRLIVSSDLERVFYPDVKSAETEKAADRFSAAVTTLQQAHPDAFLVDLGYSMMPAALMETGYGYASVKALKGLGYDAINLAAQEMVFAGSFEWGLDMITDADWRDRLLARQGLRRTPDHVSAVESARAVTKGGRTVDFLSLMDENRMSGWSGAKERLVPVPLEEVLRKRTDGATGVAITDFDPAVIERFATTGNTPDLLIATSLAREPRVRKLPNGVPIISAPPKGSLFLVELLNGEVTITPTEFYPADRYDALRTPPLPVLGIGIQNAEEALTTRAQARAGSVKPEVYGGEEHTDLTTRDRIYSFGIEIEGKPYRAYRYQNVTMLHPVGREPLNNIGWPKLDMIVVLRPDHLLHKIVYRYTIALTEYRFDIEPFVQAIAGRDPAEWSVRDELLPGARELLDWIASDVKRAIELDRRLFGEEPATP